MELPHHPRLILWLTTTSESKKLLTEEKGKEHTWHENRDAVYSRGAEEGQKV